MNDADTEMMARCSNGEMAALEGLYRRHAENVWRYAWNRTRSREAAAEIVQETFVRVARSAGQFQGRSSFATWLFAITRSVAAMHLRQKRRTLSNPVDLSAIQAVNGVTDPLKAVENKETRAAVRRAIAELPGAQRDPILLCEITGLTIRQAAQTLNWGESRVKVTLFRARRRLRRMLSHYVTGESPVKCR